MTNDSLEVPATADLAHLTVEVVPGDDLGVQSIRAYADDGDVVTLTWDEFARAVTVSWRAPDLERLRIERELATKVSVSDERGAVVFRCWSEGVGFGGTLVVRVAERVTVSDVTLRG